ncbi:MAG: hypothetical protein E7158_05055 [Firmicutes bacterium]|nr:hypothetical protein [Bacillota bacterium]
MNKREKLLDIKDILEDCLIKNVIIDDYLYHHNVSYNNTPSVVQNGILSLREQNKRGITNYSDEILKKLDDTSSHINGIDGISLSIVGLDDLYKNEEEYDPFNSSYVDILISKDVDAMRNSKHYGNEFIARKIILPDKFRSVDIRILMYIKELLNKNDITQKDINELTNKYNCLRKIANELVLTGNLVPIREMSYDNILLDTYKLSNAPRIQK